MKKHIRAALLFPIGVILFALWFATGCSRVTPEEAAAAESARADIENRNAQACIALGMYPDIRFNTFDKKPRVQGCLPREFVIKPEVER